MCRALVPYFIFALTNEKPVAIFRPINSLPCGTLDQYNGPPINLLCQFDKGICRGSLCPNEKFYVCDRNHVIITVIISEINALVYFWWFSYSIELIHLIRDGHNW